MLYKGNEALCPETFDLLLKNLPDIRDRIVKKTGELREELFESRMNELYGTVCLNCNVSGSDFVEIEGFLKASDWKSLAERMKQLDFGSSPFELLDRVWRKHKNESVPERERSVYNSSGLQLHEYIRKVRPGSRIKTESPLEQSISRIVERLIKEDIDNPDSRAAEQKTNSLVSSNTGVLDTENGCRKAILCSVKDNPLIADEREFMRKIPHTEAFSYRIDADDKLYNTAVVDVLKEFYEETYPDTRKVGRFFMSVADFKTAVERNIDKEFEYDTLKGKLEASILCLDDMDMLPSLSSREYKKFLDFLKHNRDKRFFMMGDFSVKSAGLTSRLKDIELAIKVRNISIRNLSVDEVGILAFLLRVKRAVIAPQLAERLKFAWDYFRGLRQDEPICDVMLAFVTNVVFECVGKYGNLVLREDSFDWLDLPVVDKSVSVRPMALLPLDGMVGLENVKIEAEKLVSHALVSKIKAEAGLSVDPLNLSFLFWGNPGTGKTTVAKILAEALRELGVLKKGHLVMASRGTLIGAYIGQTAPLVTEVFMNALGGVLFVDEAYALYTADLSLDSYGKEAVNTLTLLMSEYAGRLAVILAGYPKEMNYMLKSVNPGFRDRFVYKFSFEDYTEDELTEIFVRKVDTAGMRLDYGGEDTVRRKIELVCENRDESFANGRVVDNMFQSLLNIQESRLASIIYRGVKPTPLELTCFTVEDCERLLESKINCYETENRKPIGFTLS
jgi:adenylate kinase family enzyme